MAGVTHCRLGHIVFFLPLLLLLLLPLLTHPFLLHATEIQHEGVVWGSGISRLGNLGGWSAARLGVFVLDGQFH